MKMNNITLAVSGAVLAAVAGLLYDAATGKKEATQ